MNARHLLQRHPIPMSCHFEHSLAVAWALPAHTLEPLVPPGLTLDTYENRWGFVVIALVQARNLRPAFLPASCGRDYALTGYRIFVRYRDRTGRTRRGLHILRSDTSKRVMKLGGNLLTHYNYQLARIDIAPAADRLEVRITTPGAEADLHVVAHLSGEPAPLPPASPFRSAHDARRFAGPLAWTFDHEPQTSSIIMIQARRSAWLPQPTAVDIKTCSFLERAPFSTAAPRLANAFYVADVGYGWQQGIRVPIGQP
jgi:uncharacterized protein YqjF (DUF2071 family)